MSEGGSLSCRLASLCFFLQGGICVNQLRYALLVLIGASSYGISASIVKRTIGAGYTTPQVMGGQYTMGLAMMLFLFIFSKKQKMGIRPVIELLCVGGLVGLTGIFYTVSLSKIPASLAVVMLFQFTWIGILIEAIYLKQLPGREKALAVPLLWVGTLLAGGVGTAGAIRPEYFEGIVYGFLSAITFAFFIFFSGKAAKGIPSVQRSTVTAAGGLLLVLAVASPSFMLDGTFAEGLWKYGLLLGLFGIVLPVGLFAIGMPKLDSGTATILSAAELPAAIVAALLIVGEHVTLLQVAGILLILIGIAIPPFSYSLAERRRHHGRSRKKEGFQS